MADKLLLATTELIPLFFGSAGIMQSQKTIDDKNNYSSLFADKGLSGVIKKYM